MVYKFIILKSNGLQPPVKAHPKIFPPLVIQNYKKIMAFSNIFYK